jgi:hypothetical protein
MNDKRCTLRAALLLGALAARTVLAADIGLTPPSTLAFGRAVASSSPGTVVVSPAGDRTSTGGVTLINGGVAGAASFTVTGNANAAYSITFSTATLSGGSASMTIDAFTCSPTSSAWNLGASGSQIVYVGATLHVGASQAAAAYSGSYAVTVAYQ